jgi:MFS family permease
MIMDAYRPPRGVYRLYVLGLFTLVYALNFVDRQIVTILAPYLKADLGLSDAQVGLLFGTAFALFYALFALPLARLTDGWNRVWTLSIGLAFWSAMTALSGLAGNFGQLALARVGVGIGEASASPSAFSILQDYFPKARRATALAFYSSGIYLGIGASLMIGGHVVALWDRVYPAGHAPFGLAGWQAAYLAVGLPGLLLALLVVLTVREPVRGAIDGDPHPADPHPFRAAWDQLATLFPPFGLWSLRRQGADRVAIRHNLLALGGIVAIAVIAVLLTDRLLAPARRAAIFHAGGFAITTNMVQWTAVAVGAYAVLSWTQSLRLRDPGAAALLLDSPSFRAITIAGGLLSFGSYGLSAFLYLYGTRYLGLQPGDGFTIGVIAASAGMLGTIMGGLIADAARRRHPGGRLYVAATAAGLSALFAIGQYLTTDRTSFYLLYFAATVCLTMWLGPVFATGQDHVVPRLRGTATAVQFLGVNLIGLGLGPYMVGLVSDATGDLRVAILSALSPVPLVVGLFLFAARRLPAAERRVAAHAATRTPLIRR